MAELGVRSGGNEAHALAEELAATIVEARLTGPPADLVARIRASLREIQGPVIAWDPSEQFGADTVALLERGGMDVSPLRAVEPDPIADTVGMHAALLADSASVAEASRLLGVDDSRVRQRLRARTLFGIREEDGWRIPRAQFQGEVEVRGLGRILATLRQELHPVSVWRWLILPNTELEVSGQHVSPLAWLRSGGDIDHVRSVAADL